MTKTNVNRKLNSLWARQLKTSLKVERLVCFRCGRTIRVGSRVHVHHNNHSMDSWRAQATCAKANNWRLSNWI